MSNRQVLIQFLILIALSIAAGASLDAGNNGAALCFTILAIAGNQ